MATVRWKLSKGNLQLMSTNKNYEIVDILSAV